MKGISPMIAVILIIAFTVAVGGIISLWLTGYTRTATAGTEAITEALTRCAAAGFEVMSVRTATKYTYVTHNGPNLKIYPISVVFSDGSVATSFDLGTDYSITPGEVSLINLTSTFPSGATWLTVRALCEYGTVNTSAEAKCTKGETCWS